MRRALAIAVTAAACLTLALTAQTAQRSSLPASGVQDPAWSPDGKRLATSFFDRIWISAPDGRGGRALTTSPAAFERDPAWSPDGKWIAYSVDSPDGFDIYVADH